MSPLRTLGAHGYTSQALLAQSEDGRVQWELMRREGDGARFLLQLWDPRPDDRVLDSLKETFLAFWLDAGPLDPGDAHFGFDERQIWLLQPLHGTPLPKLWTEWSLGQRESFRKFLEPVLADTHSPRLLSPQVVGVKAGRVIVPRLIGTAPLGLADLFEQLAGLEGSDRPSGSPPLIPWGVPRDLSEACSRPIHGRSQELTYLKSLVLGLSAPSPMERILILQGEEGLGKEHLAAWAQAVAESEGIWVHNLDAQFGDLPGTFVERLLQTLLSGSEADFYARRPGVARSLSRRLEAYAFLTGGKPKGGELPLEPEEIKGTLEALEFATSLQHRLIHLSGLDHCSAETLTLIKDLVTGSGASWLLSVTTGAAGAKLKPLIGPLQSHPSAGMVHLHRLDDPDLRKVADDLLGAHHLPEEFLDELQHQSLGNPGLLQKLLELAQQEGRLAWSDGAWNLVPGREGPLRVHEDLVSQILLGRLQRLGPASAALVRFLALVDQPLGLNDLGRALGLGPDPLDDALQGAVSSRLVRLEEGLASIPDPHFRETVLEQTPVPELKRLARTLVGTLQERGSKALLNVRLQSLASDERTALLQVMQAIEHEVVSPTEAHQVVEQTLKLHPSPEQRARLFEFLADACQDVNGPVLVPHFVGTESPSKRALESLQHALDALAEVPPEDPHKSAFEARLHRKKAMQEVRLRLLDQAMASVQKAQEALADHPLHPEQPRIRLALGKIHLFKGEYPQGLRLLEEGLQLLSSSGSKGQHRDQEALLMELGRGLAHQCQFQRGIAMLQSAQRLLEHHQDHQGLVSAEITLGQIFQAQGHPDAAHTLLREAIHQARAHGDLSLQAQAHLALGAYRSLQHSLGPALSHLERAEERFHRMGDTALTTHTRVWKARTLAALGDTVQAEHTLLQALSMPRLDLTPMEHGDQIFLQGEMAGFQSAWRDAARLYHQSAHLFGPAGLLWRQRMAQLRAIQSDALASLGSRGDLSGLEEAWGQLESLKGPVDGAGSRWLELEWHRAHALLLNSAGDQEVVVAEALMAWGEVLAGARDLRFPALILEASARAADLLMRRGERLGARSRLQDAFASFQEIWTQLPENHDNAFLGRPDMHRFRMSVEEAGLRFILPQRVDPLADWTPTQANLPTLILPD